MREKLSTLYELQLIDNQLDELEHLRGDLPKAVNELKNKIAKKHEEANEISKEKEDAVEKINHNEEEIERLENNLKKFKSQLYQVRNNKEYDALTKEIDHSEETVSKLRSAIKELEAVMSKADSEINSENPEIQRLEEELTLKEADLEVIISANEKEEAELTLQRQKIVEKIKKPDYAIYTKIRKAKGGIAVVGVRREACSGCNNVVPAQRQIEIKQSKKLYTCESCGRILIADEIVENYK